MAKIKVTLEVYEEEIKAEAGTDNLSDAISQELGWLHDSGMFVESWEFVDEHHEQDSTSAAIP